MSVDGQQHYQRIDYHTWAVALDDEILLTEISLMICAPKIPLYIRKMWASLRWDGEYRDESGRRWGRIRVTYRPAIIFSNTSA